MVASVIYKSKGDDDKFIIRSRVFGDSSSAVDLFNKLCSDPHYISVVLNCIKD